VLSLLVAIAAAALQVTRMGQRWRQFHQRHVDLEHAGWQLFAKRGKYVGLDVNQRFAMFVDQVESIVLAYERAYSTEIARLDQDEGGSAEPGLPEAEIESHPSRLGPDL